MVKRATTLLAKDPERSLWERVGLQLAGFRITEWAVRPIYCLRTGFGERTKDGLPRGNFSHWHATDLVYHR
jgi:hypothetical protein